MPQRIDSTSVRLRGAGFRVLKQTYRFDLWNGERVFRRLLGDTIVYRYGGRQYRGLLVGIEGNDLFIQRRDSADVLTMINRSSAQRHRVPRGAALQDPAVAVVGAGQRKGGRAEALLSYLTAGIVWTAEYSAILDADEENVELTGWATIVNRSGSSFADAKVSLVAGDVHREGETIDRGAAADGAPRAHAGARRPISSPTTSIRSRERWISTCSDTVQAAIVAPTRVAAQRTYRYDGRGTAPRSASRWSSRTPRARGSEFRSPKVRVRVYATDASGAPTLVGEDRMAHTAAGERVKILSGVAFDLVGDRSRVSHTRVSRNVTEDEFRITLRNHGAKTATVTVTENLYGNWEIVKKSAEVRKKDADSAEFDVNVGAGKESVLTYTVRYTF